MRRPALLAALVILLVVLALVTSSRGHDASLDRVAQRGALRVGMDASFPPFEVVNASGDLEGLDVDLARLLAQEMDLNLEIANIAFDGLYDALACGQVDALVSAMPYDPLRTRDVSYSDPYFRDGLLWLYRPGLAPDDPVGYAGPILAEAGSEAAYVARDRCPQAEVVEVLSETDLVQEMAAGARAGLMPRVSACTLGLPQAGVAFGPLITEVPYSVVTRAQDVALTRAVAEALSRAMASEEWRSSLERWLGAGC